MDEEELIVEHDLLDFAVFHEGVFVKQSWLACLVPIYLIDSVFIRQSYYTFILIVVTVNAEFLKAEVAVSACYCYSLRLKDVKPEETSVVVEQENVSQVELGIHYSKTVEVQERSIDEPQGLYLGGILDRNQKDFHVCVVTVGLVNSVAEITSEQVCESSCLWVGKLHELSPGDGVVSNVEIIGDLLLDAVVGEVDNIPVVGVGAECSLS